MSKSTSMALKADYSTTRFGMKQLREEDDTSVYVLNISNESNTSGIRSRVTFAVSVDNNNEVSVTVPDTFIPIDLSYQVPKQHLVKSTNFNLALGKNFLRLVPSEEAREFIAGDPANQAEHIRLIKNAADSSGADAEDNYERKYEEQLNRGGNIRNALPALRNNNSDEVVGRDFDPNISEKIFDILYRSDISEDEAYSILRNNQASLSRRDIEYLRLKMPKYLQGSEKTIDFINNFLKN